MAASDWIIGLGVLGIAAFAFFYFSGSFPGPANTTLQWRQNPATGQIANFLSGRGPMGPSTGFPGTISRTQTSDPRGSGGGVGGEGVVGGGRQAEILKREKAHSAKYIAYY